MSFEPEPYTRIRLHHEEIEFLPIEGSGASSMFVYAESGKEGTVYKVLKDKKETYALKVFYPEYQDARLLENTDKLSRFKHLDGFRVAERTVLTLSTYPGVIKQYPELNYAVLMPWVDGDLWGNLILDSEMPLRREDYFKIGQMLAGVVANLETRGLAHCDLSNNNFIIDHGISSIQLIDIEDMYAPDMPKPIPTVSFGTIGYRNKWIAENGLWGPESDRFAFSILCSEIFTWHNREIRENKAGVASYFDEAEMGDESLRYRLMLSYLAEMGDEIPALFERAWLATTPAECPSIMEWVAAIQQFDARTASAQTLIATRASLAGDEEEFVVEEQVLAFEAEPASMEEVNREPSPKADSESKVEAGKEMPETIIQKTVDLDAQQTDAGSEPSQPNLESDQTLIREKPTTLIKGVPAKMELSHEILDFGLVTNQFNPLYLTISNTGGAILSGTISTEPWLEASERVFNIMPGEKHIVQLKLKSNLPKPQSGFEFRAASAVTLESNRGTEVVGASFNLPKPNTYQQWFSKKAISIGLGVAVIVGLLFFLCIAAGVILWASTR